MKKLLLCLLICCTITLFTGCANFTFGTNPYANNANTINQSDDSLYIRICTDMDNVANTLRGLDVLYYENYNISELSPIIGYNSYYNQTQNYGINNNGITNELPASSVNLSNYGINYSYQPKYILDYTNLDTSYLLSYIQSLQDLFLITNDITAGNEILNNLIYNTINQALNIKNNASIVNMANLALTVEQNNIFSESSIGINSLLTNLINSSNFISAQLDSIASLRTNYNKNIEALNIKYLTILNIIDNRIVQINNLEQLLQRLNNQLLLIKNNAGLNNNYYNYNNTTNNTQTLYNDNYTDNHMNNGSNANNNLPNKQNYNYTNNNYPNDVINNGTYNNLTDNNITNYANGSIQTSEEENEANNNNIEEIIEN